MRARKRAERAEADEVINGEAEARAALARLIAEEVETARDADPVLKRELQARPPLLRDRLPHAQRIAAAYNAESPADIARAVELTEVRLRAVEELALAEAKVFVAKWRQADDAALIAAERVQEAYSVFMAKNKMRLFERLQQAGRSPNIDAHRKHAEAARREAVRLVSDVLEGKHEVVS